MGGAGTFQSGVLLVAVSTIYSVMKMMVDVYVVCVCACVRAYARMALCVSTHMRVSCVWGAWAEGYERERERERVGVGRSYGV